MNVLDKRRKSLPLMGIKHQVIHLVTIITELTYSLNQCGYMHIEMAIICTIFLMLLLVPREMVSFRMKDICI